MRADDICERYARQRVGLTLKLLKKGDAARPDTVLIQGSADALMLLAELLLAVATQTPDDGFGISPFGDGKIHFSSAAELGLYIHRLPG